MSKPLAFQIPEEKREKFAQCYETMQDKTPLGCWNSTLKYDPTSGIVSVEDINAMTNEHRAYFKEALKVCCATPTNETVLKESISKLEKITKKKVTLKESSETAKNMAVQSLKAISETLDILKQNIQTALQQIGNLSDQDITVTKLRGLDSIVDSSITDISEAITNVTGIQTSEDNMQNNSQNNIDDIELHEDTNDDQGFKMNTDDALKNLDTVDKIIDKGNTVTLDDDQNT